MYNRLKLGTTQDKKLSLFLNNELDMLLPQLKKLTTISKKDITTNAKFKMKIEI